MNFGPYLSSQHLKDYIMEILSRLISALPGDGKVKHVCIGANWTAVVSRHCGLSSTFQDPPPHRTVRDCGRLTQKSALGLVEYARSNIQLEASIGMAAINSLIDVDEDRCIKLNAFEVLAEKGRDRDIAIVGHFPFIPRLRRLARTLWVLEKRPREGDFPSEDAKEILPKADVVGITGTSLINHTIDGLLDLCKADSWVMMIGSTTPLSPILFDYGIDMIAGSKVIDQQMAIRCISEGATFRQIEGVVHLVMEK